MTEAVWIGFWSFLVATACFLYLRWKDIRWVDYNPMEDIVSVVGFLALVIFLTTVFTIVQATLTGAYDFHKTYS